MQSSTDIEETSIDPPLDQNKTVTKEEEDLPPQLKMKGEKKTSIDISIGQNEKITEKDENHPLHLTKKDEEKTSINPPGSENEKITKKNEDYPFHLTQKDEEKASIDLPVSQVEKPTKEDKNHSLNLTKEGREKTSIDPPLSQNEKPTMDEEHYTLRLADSLLQKSEIISTGSPAVYKLPTELIMSQEKGKITKKSVGSPIDLGGRGTEKVLMVVGATGAGKTTLINGMINYILGVKWEDNFRYKLVVEDSKASQAHSQTKDITAYTFHPMKGSTVPYRFTIIDTPGFGDREGVKRDKEITNQIKEFFSIPPPNGIDHLDGIGFVTQASLAGLTPTQEYIFDSVLSIFGKYVAKNIFMLVTFADGQKPPVMEAIKNAKIPAQKFYKFNNSALFANNVKKNLKTVHGDEEDEDDEFDSMFWKIGISSFKKFFSSFEKSQSVSLQHTQEVLREPEQVQNMIEGLNPQIKMGLGKIEEMRQEENILRQREAEIEQNKEFTYEVNITKPKRIDLSGTGRHTTTCLRCNYTCHENCAYADDNDKRKCCAIDRRGYCTVCTQHCVWKEHKNLPYNYEYETSLRPEPPKISKRSTKQLSQGRPKWKV
ncbi:uncharacterized protein LOC111334512 [Stylophora pistillata]|uniref:uncharacterized protein LOC111334512 n=1 Tax=Stylophora pistillata TaxID=50429 RepID=UPI000C04536A|nr:uncharacterized protein LOC111334512 [Stylophora pistillata]